MKKLFWALMTSMTMLFACDPMEDQKNDEQIGTVDVCDKCGKEPCVCEDATCPDCGKNPCECEVPNEDFTPLQPSEQKTKISQVGQKMMEKIPASEWEKYTQLAEDFANSMYTSDDYNWGTIEDWFEAELEEAYKEEENETFKNDVVTFDDYYEILILMSNHTGLFELTESGLVIKDYNDGTKAVFTLKGKKYEIEIKSEGKVTNAIYVYDSKYEETGGDYYDDNGFLVAEDITKIYKEQSILTIGVPEKIIASITEDGTHLLDVEVKFTTNFSKDEINLTTDSFNAIATVVFNGFEVTVENIAYDAAKSEAAYKTSWTKNGENLISTSASAELKLKIETEQWENEWMDWENELRTEKHTYEYLAAEKVGDIRMYLDILGEIQAKGSCSDAMAASESLEKVYYELDEYDWETGNYKDVNENEARRHLNNFNAKININVYYDGTDTRQAAIIFDLEKHSYDWDEYWDVIPVIEFADGSKYKVEEFFTEDSFQELIDSFYEFCESFEEIIGFSIEEDMVEGGY